MANEERPHSADTELPIHHIRKPYLLMIGDMAAKENAKTALGLKDWCPEDCVGQLRLTDDAADIGLKDMTPAEARAAGAQTLVIGITPPGGRLPDPWLASLFEALDAGLDIAAGLHMRLNDNVELAERAAARGRTLHDVRQSKRAFDVGSGRKRSGKRMLMVGIDCAVGKKYTALAIQRALAARGVDADFRATGQTGILIAGRGVAVDAVVGDFVSGAAEALSPDNADDHWDIIEGQGSLFHPSFAAVTMGLVHGSQPDLMVLCHSAGRDRISSLPDYPAPSFAEAIPFYETVARLTNRHARIAGISIATAALSDAAARDVLDKATAETGLPAFDPMRMGLEAFIDALGIG